VWSAMSVRVPALAIAAGMSRRPWWLNGLAMPCAVRAYARRVGKRSYHVSEAPEARLA
jgi:hypothetical protein